MWHFIWCRCFAWHRIASSQCWMDLARSTETLTWQARNQMTLKIRIFLPNKAFPSAKNCGENVASKNVGMPTMCLSWGKTLEKPCKVLLHGVDVRLALVILGLGVNASEQPYNRQMTIHGIPNWIPFFQRKLLIKTIAGSSDLVREPKNMAKKQIMGGLRVVNHVNLQKLSSYQCVKSWEWRMIPTWSHRARVSTWFASMLRWTQILKTQNQWFDL